MRGGFALLGSVLMHAALIALSGLAVARLEPPPPAYAAPVADEPAGDTFDVEPIGEAPVSAPRSPAGEEAAAAEPAAEPAEPVAPKKKRVKRRARATDRRPKTGDSEGAATTGAGGGGKWGAATGRDIERQFARSFTRALPAAVSADRRWTVLAAGEVGSIELTIELDGAGAITAVRYDEQADAALRSIVERTMSLLRHGSFALTAEPGVGGSETLRITVRLSDGDASEARDPTEVLRLGHDPPQPGVPGSAYFALGSGRRFDAAIAVVASRAAER